MKTYIIRRLLLLFVVLFGVSILVFAILSLFSPEQRASVFITDVKQLRDLQQIIRTHHLDAPIHIQYYYWVKALLRGDLGWSITAQRPVLEAFFYFLPNTIELALFSAPLIIMIGIWLGSVSAVHQNRLIDHTTRTLAIIGWS
ncbi:MAG: ABC transporter permease, partial [Candidatus Aerophobetes bacterium]